MKFACTSNNTLITNLEGALFHPIPIDDSLWIPNNIHQLPYFFFQNIKNMNFKEIAFEVARELIANDIPADILKNIIDECFNFDIPLHSLSDDLHILELFHGPTLTFKDIGARFMSRIIRHFLPENKQIHIIVSTSGDTGSAVADAFFNMPNVIVHILYPRKLISSIQEIQMTNYGKNIIAYEVNGNFDDCQKLVKDTLADKQLCKLLTFFPANSINIARLIPQTFYYFWMYAQLKRRDSQLKNIYVSVPSGNLGNLTGGILAFKMGLPIKYFIAATNSNRAFGEYLYSNHISQKKAIPTISNAMDISIPNNLKRLKVIFNDNVDMQTKIASLAITDNETKKTIEEVYDMYGYTLDPHTSVGYSAFLKYISNNNIKHYTGVILATAHPAKFPEIMNKLNVKYDIPKQLKDIKDTGIKYNIKNNYNMWRNILIKSEGFNNITFIGMPGSGKSYIGKLLAKNINWNFIDIDKLIENTFNKKLHKIISDEGIDKFKQIEETFVLSQKGINNVFSPGGSVVYSSKAMNYLRNISLVIFLDVPFSIINYRIKNVNKRGVVLSKNQSLYDIYNERFPLYEKYSHMIINCNKYDETEIVEEIKKYI